MVFKKGKKGGKRRGYGRRFAKRIGRGGNKMMRTFGVTPSGIKVGRMVTTISAIMTPFIPAWNGKSAATIIMQGASAGQPMSARLADAAWCCAYTGLGYTRPGSTGWDATTKGIAGMGVVGGIGISLAGKFVNPLMSGSAVKL